LPKENPAWNSPPPNFSTSAAPPRAPDAKNAFALPAIAIAPGRPHRATIRHAGQRGRHRPHPKTSGILSAGTVLPRPSAGDFFVVAARSADDHHGQRDAHRVCSSATTQPGGALARRDSRIFIDASATDRETSRAARLRHTGARQEHAPAGWKASRRKYHAIVEAQRLQGTSQHAPCGIQCSASGRITSR